MYTVTSISVSGVANTKKEHLRYTKHTPLTQLLKPHAFTIRKKVQICMTECILIKEFMQSLSCVWLHAFFPPTLHLLYTSSRKCVRPLLFLTVINEKTKKTAASKVSNLLYTISLFFGFHKTSAPQSITVTFLSCQILCAC